LSVGGYHACALLADGTVECWGTAREGELGNGSNTYSLTPVPVSGLTGVTSLGAGELHTCAILAGGMAACWGDNQGGGLGNGTTGNVSATPVPVSGLPSAVAITAGLDFTCALLADGRVACWGLNGSGQLGDGTLTDSSTPVFARL
jgi:alpha-tubulin suppressor-like RCC1 family protein